MCLWSRKRLWRVSSTPLSKSLCVFLWVRSARAPCLLDARSLLNNCFLAALIAAIQ
jgi:hypothetical protein